MQGNASIDRCGRDAPPEPRVTAVRVERATLRARLIGLAWLIGLALAVLVIASLSAALLVRVAADLRLGIDPFLPERVRPRLPLHEMALRGIAVDVTRQCLLALIVLAIAWASQGRAWRRRLGLARPSPPRVPILRDDLFWLILFLWPLIHIAWVTGTARVLHVGFAQGVHLSPFMTPALIGWWLTHMVVFAPIAEELLIRGEVFARALPLLGTAGAVATTTLLFCVLHTTDLGLARPLTLVPLALALGWMRWRTGRLWPCMLLHGWSNGALIAYLLWPFGPGA